jgi:hypothetical protein
MILNSNSIILNNLGSRKKRKRVDILFNMLNEVMNMIKMEKNKIYNLFNQKNLKHLIRRSRRRRKKNREILYLKEEVMELYMEKISKKWED